MDTSVTALVAIIFGLIILTIATGTWIGVALGLVGFICLTVFLKGMDVVIAAVAFNSVNSYPMAAVPLFIFMGQIINQSGLNQKIYLGASKLVGVIPGSLVQANILSCSVFAACSGSSHATAATIGVVAYDEQARLGYNKRLVVGSIAAGGTLGILIPPSITMVIYGGFVGESVGKLFMGGVVPGLVTALLFMGFIFVISLIKPSLIPEKRHRITLRYFRNAVTAVKDIWPALVLVVFIMGSIYGGLATPTEVAAISVVIALTLATLLKKMNFDVLKRAALESISLSGLTALILMGAGTLGYGIALLKIPETLVQMVAAADLSPMGVWFVLIMVYLILGCFIPGIPVLLLTLPVTYPLMISLGFDGVWFGVMLVMMVECGSITPPVGGNLFVLQAISKEPDVMNIAKGAFPFFLCLLFSISIWSFFPQLVLFLPNKMLALRKW